MELQAPEDFNGPVSSIHGPKAKGQNGGGVTVHRMKERGRRMSLRFADT